MINILNWVNEMSKLKLKRRSSLKFLKYPLFLLILVFLVNYFFIDIYMIFCYILILSMIQRYKILLLYANKSKNKMNT